jgi:prepilin-type N-terminal cleavage/methylation domain-containing protein
MSIFSRYFRSFSRRSLRGFTLVELLVVTAVITIITGFLLFNQAKFNSSTLLRSLAYSVALTVRQAQLYGVSVRGFSSGGTVSFAQGHGVVFSNTPPITSFTMFADLDNDNGLDSGEAFPAYRLSTGYQISKFCGVLPSGDTSCSSGGVGLGSTLNSLTIYFRRPNLDALFTSTCTVACTENYTSAYITVKPNASSDTRSVKITNTGQITICPLNTEPPSC